MTKVSKVLGWLLLVLAVVALVPTIGHILAFGLLVVKLVAEVAFILALAAVGIWLLRR